MSNPLLDKMNDMLETGELDQVKTSIMRSDESQDDKSKKITYDTETDVDYARENLKRLIVQNQEAIESMQLLAQDAEHPRAFEVLAGLYKQAADMNEQLINIQKKKKDIVIKKETASGAAAGGTTNNTAVFVGSTSDLQHALKQINAVDSDADSDMILLDGKPTDEEKTKLLNENE